MDSNLEIFGLIFINIYEEGQERYKRESLHSSVNYSRGSVMVWSCISTSGLGDFVKFYGMIIPKKYHQILIHHAVLSENT